jgi:hypothetical protein
MWKTSIGRRHWVAFFLLTAASCAATNSCHAGDPPPAAATTRGAVPEAATINIYVPATDWDQSKLGWFPFVIECELDPGSALVGQRPILLNGVDSPPRPLDSDVGSSFIYTVCTLVGEDGRPLRVFPPSGTVTSTHASGPPLTAGDNFLKASVESTDLPSSGTLTLRVFLSSGGITTASSKPISIRFLKRVGWPAIGPATRDEKKGK